jgi:hypothetical protein
VEQPPNVHIIVEVPAPTPVTIPVEAPIVATPVLLLLQVTPPVALESVVVLPTHTVAVPVIAAGVVFTVILYIVRHPVLMV